MIQWRGKSRIHTISTWINLIRCPNSDKFHENVFLHQISAMSAKFSIQYYVRAIVMQITISSRCIHVSTASSCSYNRHLVDNAVVYLGFLSCYVAKDSLIPQSPEMAQFWFRYVVYVCRNIGTASYAILLLGKAKHSHTCDWRQLIVRASEGTVMQP